MRRVAIVAVLVVLMVPSIASAAPGCHRVHRWVWRTEHHRREYVRVGKLVCVALPPRVPAAPAGPVLATQSPAQQQILQRALEVAKANGDADPAFVVYAPATLNAASEVLEQDGHSFFPAGEDLGDASSPVDVVVMGGHFTSDGPAPLGVPAPKGTALAITIDAENFVEITTLGDKLPPLSQLGPLTRLA
jgi:hypothetical protein